MRRKGRMDNDLEESSASGEEDVEEYLPSKKAKPKAKPKPKPSKSKQKPSPKKPKGNGKAVKNGDGASAFKTSVISSTLVELQKSIYRSLLCWYPEEISKALLPNEEKGINKEVRNKVKLGGRANLAGDLVKLCNHPFLLKLIPFDPEYVSPPPLPPLPPPPPPPSLPSLFPLPFFSLCSL